jgi:hypothetical protein
VVRHKVYSIAIANTITFNVIQTKEKSYYNQHTFEKFFFLTIEVYGGLHKHVNVFVHNCANAI